MFQGTAFKYTLPPPTGSATLPSSTSTATVALEQPWPMHAAQLQGALAAGPLQLNVPPVPDAVQGAASLVPALGGFPSAAPMASADSYGTGHAANGATGVLSPTALQLSLLQEMRQMNDQMAEIAGLLRSLPDKLKGEGAPFSLPELSALDMGAGPSSAHCSSRQRPLSGDGTRPGAQPATAQAQVPEPGTRFVPPERTMQSAIPAHRGAVMWEEPPVHRAASTVAAPQQSTAGDAAAAPAARGRKRGPVATNNDTTATSPAVRAVLFAGYLLCASVAVCANAIPALSPCIVCIVSFQTCMLLTMHMLGDLVTTEVGKGMPLGDGLARVAKIQVLTGRVDVQKRPTRLQKRPTRPGE